MTVVASRDDAKLRQQLAKMMDHQFWRWGCDAKHQDGNLLVRYGFKRIPPLNRQSASSSAYDLRPRAGAQVVLRSFAVFYGDNRLGGLLLKRFDYRPYRTPASEFALAPHEDSDLPCLFPATPDDDGWRSLAVDLVEQIVAYEAWVVGLLGIGYVEETLIVRRKRPFVPADETETAWRRLASRLSQGAYEDRHR